MPKPKQYLMDVYKKWSAWFFETAQQEVKWQGDAPRELRWKLVASAIIATFSFGYIGYQLLTSNFHTSETPVAIVPNNGLTTTSPTPSPSVGVPTPIVAATSFDPLGDKKENDGSLNAIFDSESNNAQTTWTTSTYKTADLGKDGVGVVLDLGSTKSVTAVEINFAAAGQAVEVYLTDQAVPDLKTAKKLSELAQTPALAKIQGTSAVAGRYVLIWLTSLPAVTDGFAAGIANVQVLL